MVVGCISITKSVSTGFLSMHRQLVDEIHHDLKAVPGSSGRSDAGDKACKRTINQAHGVA